MQLPITTREIGLYEVAIKRILNQLFRRWGPEDYSMVMETFEFLPPSAHRDAKYDNATRELHFGGIRVEIDTRQADEKYYLSIEHRGGTLFFIFLNITRKDNPIGLTANASEADFNVLDERIRRLIYWTHKHLEPLPPLEPRS